MTYDLRRLRLAALIRRLDHADRYFLTTDGIKVAVFYTKLHNRLPRPLLAAVQPQAPAQLRDALHVIDQHISDYIPRPARPRSVTNLTQISNTQRPRIATRAPRDVIRECRAAMRGQ